MAEVVAENVKTIIRIAPADEDRTINLGAIVGLNDVKSAEVYNTSDPAAANTSARVKFNTESNDTLTDFRLLRGDGSYPVFARIRNVTIRGIGAAVELAITITW